MKAAKKPSTSPAREPMSGVDCAWLRMDHPTNLMVINGVLLFDTPVEGARVRRLLEHRLLSVLRFRERIHRAGRRFFWELDPDFDLGNHVVEERLPEPGGDLELRAFIDRRMAEPLPYDRPLWRLHMIHNHQGATAMLWRLHHCIADGIALMLLLLSLTDLEPDGDGGEVVESANPLLSLFHEHLDPGQAKRHLEAVLPEALRLMTRPSEALQSARRWALRAAQVPAFGRMSLRRADRRSPFKGPLGIEKRVAWSRAVPLEEVEAVRGAIGGTVNDVLLTAMAGGLRRYLLDQGGDISKARLRGIIPVSLRPLEQMSDLGNRFGLVFLSLPVGIAHPGERLAQLRRNMRALKKSVEPLVVLNVLQALGRLPKSVQNLVVKIFGTKATAVMTNVPGPKQTLYFAGQPIRGLVFWVPQSGRLGLGISIASYAGAVRLGVATDAGLVPDPWPLVEGFHEELASMHELT